MRPGDVIDARYRLVAPLGSGGMGAVWRALDLQLEREVALKVLKAPPDAITKRRFAKEVVTGGRLRHPNAVVFYDTGELPDGSLYMTTEIAPGRPLSVLRGQHLPMPAVLQLAGQLCDVLSVAHDLGITHRDLKPENVMVTEDGAVKVIDFGIAKLADAQGDLTRTGEILGTPQYMSPEQLRAQPVGPASDQYSLAVMLYELLEGHLPFEAPSLLELGMAHIHAPVPPIERPDCPAPMRMAIARALAKHPSERFPDVRSFGRALLPDARPSLQPRESDDRRKGVLAVIAVAAVATVVLGVSVLSLSAPDDLEPVPVAAPSREVPTWAPEPAREPAPEPSSPQPRREERWKLNAPSGDECSKTNDDARKTEDGFAWVPSTYSTERRSPVLLLLASDDAQRMEIMESSVRNLAESRGLVVVAPTYEKLKNWHDPTDWKDARSFVDELTQNLCVDRDEVIVVTQRGEGKIADFLACEPWVSAAAMYAHPREEAFAHTCEGRTAPTIAVWPMNTTRQPVDGGEPTCHNRDEVRRSLEAEDLRRRSAHQCSGEPTSTKYDAGTCVRYTCATPYVSCHVEGGIFWPKTRSIPYALCDPVAWSDFPIALAIDEFLDSLEVDDDE